MSDRRRFARWIACGAAAVSLAWTAAPRHAAAEVVANNNGPAFLVISSVPAFDTNVGGVPVDPSQSPPQPIFGDDGGKLPPPTGSPLVILPIGTFVAGFDVRNTTFQSGGAITNLQLQALISSVGGLEGLDGHAYTIFGAVDTLGPNSIHMFTPDPGLVPTEVQQAVWRASPMLSQVLAMGPGENNPQYPMTTLDLANFVYQHQMGTDFPPESPPASLQAIAVNLFSNPQGPLHCTTCEADGQLFPHDPELGNPLFTHEIQFDQSGSITVHARTLVKIDVKPGLDNATNPVNLGSKGTTPVAILSSRGLRPDAHGVMQTITFFDPHDVNPATVTLAAPKTHGATGQNWTGAHALLGKGGPGVSFTDLNGDGVADMVLHFSTPDLANAALGGVAAGTKSLVLEGDMFGNKGGIEGTDKITVVPR